MAWDISLSDPFIILIFIGDSAEPLWDSSKIRLQPTSVSRPKVWEPKPQNTGFDLMSITFLSNFVWHFFFNFTVASIKYVPHWSMACICEERKKRIITYKEATFYILQACWTPPMMFVINEVSFPVFQEQVLLGTTILIESKWGQFPPWVSDYVELIHLCLQLWQNWNMLTPVPYSIPQI